MTSRIPVGLLGVLFLGVSLAAQEPATPRKKLVAAAPVAAQPRVVAVQPAPAAIVVRSSSAGLGPNAVRQQVDPQDPLERFLLLTPGGPLIVETAMTIDGLPFRVAREKLVDELYAAADKNQDGKAEWGEALESTRFTLGRVRIVNEQQRQAYLKTLDKNTNGLVDREEVRQFLAQFFQGPAFNLVGGTGSGGGFRTVLSVNGRALTSGGAQADVLSLLDTDNNGLLDEKELAAAPARLKSRDANDNDLLLPAEINGTDRPVAGRQARIRTAASQPRLAVLLGPTAEAGSLYAALQQKYQNEAGDIVAASFAALPKLFESLDTSQDGKLQQDEVLALNETSPHVELVVDLARTKDAQGLKLKSLAPELMQVSATDRMVTVELPGVMVSFDATPVPQTNSTARSGDAYLMRYDKDKNGYLDKDELVGNLAQQFVAWDADEDGKVFAQEIVAFYDRMLAPQMSQVRATTTDQGNPLFQALDQSGDGRLSLREMRTAGQRIKMFDEDRDNRISRSEIPETLSVAFGLGNSAIYRTTVGGATAANPTPAVDAPEWFVRMDRNGDGDVTLKEFLADEGQFKKLDTNGDGFIEPNEARQAGKSQ